MKIGKLGKRIFQIRRGEGPSAPFVVMFHGLTGDEKSMWVLESALPSEVSILTIRAFFPSQSTGYSWIPIEVEGLHSLETLRPAAIEVVDLISNSKEFTQFSTQSLILMGFSQGAAFAFALAHLIGEISHLRANGVIALAGFLPDGDLNHLEGIPVFWGHGTRDLEVPIESARNDVEHLKALGAQIEFCETDVGHKLGIECLRGLRQWMRDTYPH